MLGPPKSLHNAQVCFGLAYSPIVMVSILDKLSYDFPRLLSLNGAVRKRESLFPHVTSGALDREAQTHPSFSARVHGGVRRLVDQGKDTIFILCFDRRTLM